MLNFISHIVNEWFWPPPPVVEPPDRETDITEMETVLDEDNKKSSSWEMVEDRIKGNYLYTGSLLDGKIYGYGVLKDTNGEIIYQGGFNQHGYNEFGKLRLDIGTKSIPDFVKSYEGCFKDGHFHGPGAYTFFDGSVLESDFIENKLHPGTRRTKLTLDNGDVFACTWESGESQIRQQIAFGTQPRKIYKVLINGIVFRGQFAMGLLHGEGEVRTEDGTLLAQGNFVLSRQDGKGIRYLTPNSTFTGTFKAGRMWDGVRHTNVNGSTISMHISKGVKTKATMQMQNGVTNTMGPDGYHDPDLRSFIDAPDKKTSALLSARENLAIKFENKKRAILKAESMNLAKELFNNLQSEILKETKKNLLQPVVPIPKILSRKEWAHAQDLLLDEKIHSLGLADLNGKSMIKPTPRLVEWNFSTAAATDISDDQDDSSQSSASIGFNNAGAASQVALQLKIHKRVQRWKERAYTQIQKFEDCIDGHIVKQYAGLSKEEIEVQRMHHYLPDLENLLVPSNANKFYIKSLHSDHTQYHLMAMLMPNGQEENLVFGLVEIAVGHNGIIFHKKFEPLELGEGENDIEKYKNRFFVGYEQVPEIHNSLYEDEEPWETNMMTTKTLSNGALELSFKHETYKLRVSLLGE